MAQHGIQRQSEPVSFTDNQRTQLTTPQLAAARFAPRQTVSVGDDAWLGRLAQGITGTIEKLGNQYTDVELEKLYLQGAAKAGQIESEAEIEGNSLTRDWEVAGYRDTMGRLAMSSMEAKLAADMPRLRELSPEKFREHIDGLRAEFMPQVQGMSREQRLATFGKLLTWEQAGIKKHASEHKKYIVDQQGKSIAASVHTRMQTLTAARQSTPDAHDEALRTTAAGIVADIVYNPRLPADVKQGYIVEAMELALTSDNIALYDYFNNNPILNPDGSKGMLLGTLPLDKQEKLARQYKATHDRTSAQREMNYLGQVEQTRSMIDNGTYTGTLDDLTSFLSYGLQTRAISGEKYGSILNAYFDAGFKNLNVDSVANAFEKGGGARLRALGKSESEGLEAARKKWQRDSVGVDQQFDRLVVAGQNGAGIAYKAAGELIGPAVMQLARPDGTPDPVNQVMLVKAHQLLDTFKKNSLDAYEAQFLAGLPEAAAVRLQRLRTLGEREGLTSQQALTKVLELEKQEQGMSPQEKAAISASSFRDDAKLVENIEPVGMLGAVWGKVKATVGGLVGAGTEAAALDIVRPRFGDLPDEVVAEQAAGIRSEVLREMRTLRSVSIGLSSEAAYKTALSNVARRTVQTDMGPLVIPHGATAEKFFGTPLAADNAKVGEAIGNYFKRSLPEGHTAVISSAQGVIAWQAVDAKGIPTNQSGTFKPTELRDEINRMADERMKRYREIHADGKRVHQNGVEIAYNGVNTAMVDEAMMLKFRDNLVQNEGVRDRVYKDTVGVETVGVGVSKRNAHYPKPDASGKVARKDIETSFKAASNDAARVGAAVQSKLNLKGGDWFLLLSELAYQSGPAFYKQDAQKKFLEAPSEDTLKQTKAYRLAGESRKKHYLDLLNKAQKG